MTVVTICSPIFISKTDPGWHSGLLRQQRRSVAAGGELGRAARTAAADAVTIGSELEGEGGTRVPGRIHRCCSWPTASLSTCACQADAAKPTNRTANPPAYSIVTIWDKNTASFHGTMRPALEVVVPPFTERTARGADGFAHLTCSTGHAGVSANSKLTLEADHLIIRSVSRRAPLLAQLV